MASPYDLTTLAAVKAWLGASATSASDTILAGAITAVSRLVYGYINRAQLLPRTMALRFDGFGGSQRRIIIPEFPVLSISSVMIDTSVIPAAVMPTAQKPNVPFGYILDAWDGTPPGKAQVLDFYGYCVTRGRNNIQVTGQFGYQVTGEALTVPGGAGPFTISSTNFAQPFGAWAMDAGVTYANGTALLKVASAPALGQYSLAIVTAGGVYTGTYTFNAADHDAAVLISYGYIPADLAQAAMEIVVERFKYRDRIGQGSKTLAGQETITFTQKDMNDSAKLMLQPYRGILAM